MMKIISFLNIFYLICMIRSSINYRKDLNSDVFPSKYDLSVNVEPELLMDQLRCIVFISL